MTPSDPDKPGKHPPRATAASDPTKAVRKLIKRQIEEEVGEGFDDELDLVRRSGLVLRVGRMSLGAGTGSYRVKKAMATAAAALGIDRHHALVTLTEITTTSHRGRSFRTEVTELRSIGVDADRLTRLQNLSNGLVGRTITPSQLQHQLDEIEHRPPLYPAWASGAFAGIACCAFAFLIGEGWPEMIAALLGAGAGQFVRRLLLHRSVNVLGATMLSALTAMLVFLGSAYLIGLPLGNPHLGTSGYIAAVLFLVPGFPLVTAALDLARLDISAGIARLTYAALIVSSAAVVVWGVAHAFEAAPEHGALVTAGVWGVLARLVASFAGVLGFALMFNSPLRTALAAAAVGAAPNVGRIAMVEQGSHPAVAAATAALAVGLIAAFVAPRVRAPRITVSVPAVVIMVPGTLVYLALAGIGDGATWEAVGYGIQACLVALGIAIGLAVARMLTDRQWALGLPGQGVADVGWWSR